MLDQGLPHAIEHAPGDLRAARRVPVDPRLPVIRLGKRREGGSDLSLIPGGRGFRHAGPLSGQTPARASGGAAKVSGARALCQFPRGPSPLARGYQSLAPHCRLASTGRSAALPAASGASLPIAQSPARAIESATRDAADLLGAADRVGSVQAGRYANLVAVTGDPLKEPALLGQMSFVMKGGVVYRRDGRPTFASF